MPLSLSSRSTCLLGRKAARMGHRLLEMVRATDADVAWFQETDER